MSASPAFAWAICAVRVGIAPAARWLEKQRSDTFSLDLLRLQDTLCMGQKKNPHAQALGALGGKARAKSLSDAAISKIASKGGKARAKASAADAARSQRNRPLPPANANEHSSKEREELMRSRKQAGQIIRIGDRWYVRYWERRNIGGTIERKRVTHQFGAVTTRGKHPPADIKQEAERHMSNSQQWQYSRRAHPYDGRFRGAGLSALGEQNKRPSTLKGYRDIWEDHLKALCERIWLKEVRTYHVQGWLNEIGAAKV